MSRDEPRDRIAGIGSTRAHGLVALTLTVLHTGYLASLLVRDHFVTDYPFTAGDTFDYLRGAMALTGADLDATGRPPLLPLVMAALDSAGLLGWLPVLFVLVPQAFALMVFAELITRSRVAAWTGWGILALGDAGVRWASGLEPSLIGACLLAASLLLISGRWSRAPLAPWLSGGMAGAAYLLHQLALIYPVVLCLAAALGRRRQVRRALLVFLPFPALWLGVRTIVLGSPGDAGISHWGLVAWHTDAAPAYLALGLTLLGAPLGVVALGGLVHGLRARDLTTRLSVAATVLILLFFVFLYDYMSRRFLLYVLPFAVLLATRALATIRHRGVAAGLAMLLVWTAMLPRSANDRQTSSPLLPGVDLRTDVRLLPRAPGPIEQVRLMPRSPAIFGHNSMLRRLRGSRLLHEGRHAGPAPRLSLPPSETTADLYLLAAGEANTVMLRSRIQVLLQRRVHLVPPQIVEGLICALDAREAGDLADLTVWRATLPDGRTTTLSHRADQRPLDALAKGACDELPDDLPAAAATLGAAWSGRQIGLIVDRVDPRLGLALFSIAGELIVVAPEQEPAIRRLVGRAAAGRSDFETVVDGITWRVLIYPGAARDL